MKVRVRYRATVRVRVRVRKYHGSEERKRREKKRSGEERRVGNDREREEYLKLLTQLAELIQHEREFSAFSAQ